LKLVVTSFKPHVSWLFHAKIDVLIRGGGRVTFHKYDTSSGSCPGCHPEQSHEDHYTIPMNLWVMVGSQRKIDLSDFCGDSKNYPGVPVGCSRSSRKCEELLAMSSESNVKRHTANARAILELQLPDCKGSWFADDYRHLRYSDWDVALPMPATTA
jgi:hypothetical protein